MRAGMKRLRGCWLLPFLLTSLCGSALAQSGAMAEYAVKAALLLKLPQFVYRSEALRRPVFGMCLLGGNPFGGALEKIAQTPLDGRSVKIIRLGSQTDAEECDLVFIARSEASNLEAALRRLSKVSAVTVSDIEGFAKSGGMVEFAIGGEAAAVSILINRKAANRQNIEFNAQLLSLARLVDP